MTASMDDREKVFENKFKMDEELRFKVQMRATKLFGQWAAAKLGITDPAGVEKYVDGVIDADFDEPGIQDVLRKVKADFDAREMDSDIGHLEREYNQCLAEAKKQFASQN
ncbi:MAG TPA: DUF1476 domain-containing protein [Patescibacteria group bacterium]|nr:DUF1476 domain-containing protein [Patescibacteria group bacterium]